MSLLKDVCSQSWGALCSGDSFSPECLVKYFSNSAVQKRTLSIFTSLFLSIGNLRVLKGVFSPCSCGLTEALKSGHLQLAFSLYLAGLAPAAGCACAWAQIAPMCWPCCRDRDRKGHLPRICLPPQPFLISLRRGVGWAGAFLPLLAQGSWAACSLWEPLSHHPA